MSGTPDILKKILKRKVEEITERSQKESLVQLSQRAEQASPVRGFIQAIQSYWTYYYNLRQLTLFDFDKGVPLQADFDLMIE